MYQKERLDNILDIVKQYGYVTVKYLVGALHYSNATINRDLNVLESQKLVHRTYGGVEIVKKEDVPLPFRYHKMRSEKLKIGKKASEFVRDGDVIFIDASTTTECMAEFLTEKKDITVITNNVAIVTHLSQYGINVICLGGKVVEPPCMLCGTETIENAMKYYVDKMFFASGYVSADGRIAEGGLYYLLHTVIAKNAKEIYHLADHEKFHREVGDRKYLLDFSQLKGIISDYEFSEEIKAAYPDTEFIKV
ncbi:MAG: DeoR/GlpR transcriptional regulator [Clostridia bacterium]|nr:DeoR/GlpR transcriptional regulator [Clostridia bacterium]